MQLVVSYGDKAAVLHQGYDTTGWATLRFYSSRFDGGGAWADDVVLGGT